MTQQTTQQASQTPGNGSNPSPSSQAAEPTLDTLVKQFETSTASPTKQVADVVSAFRPVIEYVQEERQAKETKAVEADVERAVEYVRGKIEGGDKISKKVLRGFLREHAIESP